LQKSQTSNHQVLPVHFLFILTVYLILIDGHSLGRALFLLKIRFLPPPRTAKSQLIWI